MNLKSRNKLKMEKWISTKSALPPEGKYVLARHCRGTWHDSTDQDNVNCVVVKLVRGISKEEREKMKNGELPDPLEKYMVGYGVIHGRRSGSYAMEDEAGNNKKPYAWKSFGPDSFFGQDITHWMSIPKIHKKSNPQKP